MTQSAAADRIGENRLLDRELSSLEQKVTRVFDTLLADNAEAWDLDGDGRWHRARPGKGGRSRATDNLIQDTLARARRRLASRSE